MGGRNQSESVADINRNRRPASPGIGGRNRAEYAPESVREKKNKQMTLFKNDKQRQMFDD
jgi:hypothetical protein